MRKGGLKPPEAARQIQTWWRSVRKKDEESGAGDWNDVIANLEGLAENLCLRPLEIVRLKNFGESAAKPWLELLE